MKSKLVFIVVFLFLGSLSLIYLGKAENTKGGEGERRTLTESLQTTNSWLEKFYIGAVHDGIDCKYDYANLDTLGFNIFHMYALGNEYDVLNNKYYPYMDWGECGAINNDRLLTPVGDYAAGVNGVFSEMHSEIPEMRIVTMRPKIEYLCRGQRSDYQCEEVSPNDSLWFYAFNYHNTLLGQTETDTSIYGGDTVKAFHCIVEEEHQEGFVINRLRANTEQCHRIISYGNQWQGDSYCIWKIKPRIRIDSAVAHGQNTDVCKIIVIAQSGNDTLLSTIITANEFLDGNGKYDGNYIEEYNLSSGKKLIMDEREINDWGDNWMYNARDLRQDDSDPNMNKADIQVYWYGNCDMWIDYVRVDDDIADKMFKGYYDNPLDSNNRWIKNEVEKIGLQSGGENPIFMKYYLETLEFNHLPCAAYVNERLKYYSDGKLDLIQDLTNTISVHVNWSNRTRIENPQFLKKYYIDKVGFTQVFEESYPMTGCYEGEQFFSRIPNTLTITSGERILAQAISPDKYDDSLQSNINHYPYQLEGNDTIQPKCSGSTKLLQDRGNFRFRLQLGDSISKLADIPFIFMPQVHQWFRAAEVRREPTNEELNMMVNTSLCYGVKGILYFAYNSIDLGGGQYGTGIADYNLNLRHQNYYGQTNPDKVQTLVGITERIAERWGPYIIKFDNTNRKSAIYDFESQRQDFLSSTYFNEIKTYPPIPSDLEIVSSVPDDPQYTYIQSAVFQNPSETGKNYFMLVNRRCSPYDSSENQNGGRRRVKIKFDANSTEFLNFKNWVVIDLYNNSKVAVFDKTAGSQIDLGWYLPGEGKLYTILPVMQTGGTLVCDESISSCSFICDSTVFNNGFDITINKDVTISFSTKGEIIMEEGEFICGLDPQMSQGRVEFKGNNENWKGISLTNCDKIEIVESDFKNIAFNGNDSTSRNSAITIINSYDFNINHCNFEMSTSSGGVNILVTSFNDVEWRNTLVMNSTFTAKNGSNQNAISVTSLAEIVSPVRIENCTISKNDDETITTGIQLIEVVQGIIKNNDISSCFFPIDLMSSSADICDNTITGDFENSSGIRGKVASYLFLNPSVGCFTGGKNSISQTGENNKNIEVLDSYFYLNEGENTFNIGDYYSGDAYYLYGNMPSWTPNTNQTANCFKKEENNIDNEDTVNVYCCVEDLSGDTIEFKFFPFDCESSELENFIVISFPGIVNDTIYKTGGGMGGGFKSEERNTNMEISPEKLLRDSINLGFRMRNYNQVENQSKRYIGSYPDSVFSIEALQKLYYATIMTDSVNHKTGLLKTYYETLIQNNQSNIALIKRAFYLIQKCKVKLGQYTSALEGFQIIIQSNPYSWEGLLASWDYAATLLKLGQGGAERNMLLTDKNETIFPNPEDNLDTLINRLKTKEGYDKKAFNPENRKKIYGNIQSALNETKHKQEEHIRELKEIKEKNIRGINPENGNRGIKAKQLEGNLAELEALHKTVKVKKPKTIKELNTIIQSDIRSINKVKSSNSGDTKKSLIPKEYSLSQNYPNPFNSMTNVKFQMLNSGRVKLAIYDLLGREVKILVNEIRQAGIYKEVFSMDNLSSGIYFLRILVNDGKDFTDVKKIVLLK